MSKPVVSRPTQKLCPKCGQWKEIDWFVRKDLRRGYYSKHCRICLRKPLKLSKARTQKSRLDGTGLSPIISAAVAMGEAKAWAASMAIHEPAKARIRWIIYFKAKEELERAVKAFRLAKGLEQE